MLVREAKTFARRWVDEHAQPLPGFVGAFHHGSTAHLPDDAILTPTSDLDVMLVLDGTAPPGLAGKRLEAGVLLEISALPVSILTSAEAVLANYHLAPSLAVPSIIADPTGTLTPLQQAVAREYATRAWVIARCEDAARNCERYLRSLDQPDLPFPNQVMAWLFAAGILTHILLVAGLRNPTVRTRYLAARDLLAEYGLSEFYPALLVPLGCTGLSPTRIAAHLDALTPVFDLAATRPRFGLPYASDVSPAARPIAIDGSRALIDRGDHLEAVFWIAVTFSRCLAILDRTASPDHSLRTPGAPHADSIPDLPDPSPAAAYRTLLADLGTTSPTEIRRRRDQIAALIPQLWQLAETIIAANPHIHP